MKTKMSNSVLRLAGLLLISFLFFGTTAYAKSSTCVKLTVVDHHQKPIDFARATIIDANTNKVVKEGVCNENGEVKLKGVRAGKYIIKVNTPGYATKQVYTVDVAENCDKVTLKTVTLEEDLLENEVIKDKMNALNQNSEAVKSDKI